MARFRAYYLFGVNLQVIAEAYVFDVAETFWQYVLTYFESV